MTPAETFWLAIAGTWALFGYLRGVHHGRVLARVEATPRRTKGRHAA